MRSFYGTPTVAASIFCVDFVDISYDILIIILEDTMWLQFIYFLNTISILFMERLFPIDGTLTLVLWNLLCFHYGLNQPSWKIHGIS